MTGRPQSTWRGCDRGVIAVWLVAGCLTTGWLAGCLPSGSTASPFSAGGTVDMVACLRPGTDAQALINGPVLSRPAPPNVLEGSEVPPGVAAIRADPAHHAIDIKLRPDRGPADADNLRAALTSLPQVERVQENVVRSRSCQP